MFLQSWLVLEFSDLQGIHDVKRDCCLGTEHLGTFGNRQLAKSGFPTNGRRLALGKTKRAARQITYIGFIKHPIVVWVVCKGFP